MGTCCAIILLLAVVLCVFVQESMTIENRRALKQLNDFKDEVRKELRYINDDIFVLFQTNKNLTKMVKMDLGHVISKDEKEADGELSKIAKKDQASNDETGIIDELIQTNDRLFKAFQSEKLINRQLQQRLDSFEERITDRLNDAVNTMARQVQRIREEILVKAMNENIRQVEKDVEGLRDTIDTVSGDVSSVRQTVEKLTDTVDDIRANVSELASNIPEVCSSVCPTSTIQTPNTQSRTEVVATTTVSPTSTIQTPNTQSRTEVVASTTAGYRSTCKTVPRSGVYNIYFDSMNKALPVYCDQDTADGGWIVIMRRQDGHENFNRPWRDYKNGFGDLEGEFWAGNELLHQLTESKQAAKLRIDMKDFEGGEAYAEYEKFVVGPESDKYRLQLSGYEGTAGDSLISAPSIPGKGYWMANQQQFSTFDEDNDGWSSGHCAAHANYKGGWWFKHCSGAHLTGIYNLKTGSSNGMKWFTWKPNYEPLRFVEMKMRID